MGGTLGEFWLIMISLVNTWRERNIPPVSAFLLLVKREN
jgi:hypothetical protein